jgi:arsenate reductase
MEFDYVVTVCDDAREACPTYPHAGQMLHVSFEDPAAFEGSDEEKIMVFRKIRDAIRMWLEESFVPNQ